MISLRRDTQHQSAEHVTFSNGALRAFVNAGIETARESEIGMGKYVFAWLLGVPAGLLALIYLLAHL